MYTLHAIFPLLHTSFDLQQSLHRNIRRPCDPPCRTLGQRVFLQPTVKEEDGWRDSLYRAYKSGQQSMRVAVYGCKHDAAMFEILLKEYCTFEQPGLSGNAMIDTACLDTPKVKPPRVRPEQGGWGGGREERPSRLSELQGLGCM